ncbi:MAG: hypothetical protein MJ132_06770 [Clostridia bacterium]|nr:hypothetical protein [Clostridia bacterium]
MKKIISIFLAAFVFMTLVACTAKQNGTVKEDKNGIKIIQNEKCMDIVQQLKTLSINTVFEDIKNIDFSLNPDFNGKDYTIKEKAGQEHKTKEIQYYQNEKLVYTKYEGYDMTRFSSYTTTASGLDATVDYFTYDDGARVVNVETPKYRIYVNEVNADLPYGIGYTEIVLLAENSLKPFDCSVSYMYDAGIATFDSATYLENGDYIRYSFFVDQDAKQSDMSEVIVSAETPALSDAVIKVLQNDKSYRYAAILIGNTTQWYNGEGWYVKTQIAIAFDHRQQAEEYLKKNALNGKIDDYGSAVIVIDDVVFEISKNLIETGGKLKSFVSEELDIAHFEKITLSEDGVIEMLDSADISQAR